MLEPKHIDQLLETGVARLRMYDNKRHFLGEEAKKPLVRAAARPHGREQGWHRTQRSTLFLGKQGLRGHLLPAERLAPRATRLAHEVEADLQHFAAETGIAELATPFNRVGYNYMHGSTARPALIGPHQDGDELEGVVFVLGLEGAATLDSIVPGKSDIAILACKNLCDARGIERVWHGSTAYQDKTTLTLARVA